MATVSINVSKEKIEKMKLFYDEFKQVVNNPYIVFSAKFDGCVVNIYTTGEGENITIVNYELFNKSTNAKIEGIATEAELRTVLGMYNVGTYTAEFTLVDIGMIGAGFNDDKNYTYRDYGFVDEKGIEYEMRFINPGSNLDALVEGNKYTVTFEVTEGTFKYEFTIKEIK